ncbi:MAG TPA: hypothetical protein VHS33_13775 [Sphingomicrobium sp.]|jgi:hypothetical protein|nr:hypothetical protein [Sphingomicrobium sp.]
MRLLAIVLFASVPSAGLAAAPRPPGHAQIIDPDAGAQADCPPISRYEASRRGDRLVFRHLDELPGADLYKAVYRHVGSCSVPIIVRYNLGRSSKQHSGKR